MSGKKRYGVMFAGQGAQHPGMGKELAERSALARELFLRADDLLGWKLSELCFEGTQENLTACAHCQPAIFVASIAAFQQWRSDQDFASEVISAGAGLSLGEWSALTASGVLDFETALRLVAKRGALMDECCQKVSGAMGAVIGCDDALLEKLSRTHGVTVANYNCPGQRVVSGGVREVDALLTAVAPNAMKTQRLQVAGAYHSPLMAPAAAAFRECLEEVAFDGEKKFPVLQNVTGEWAPNDPTLLKDRLAQQICSPVRWESCAKALMDSSDELCEFGPGHVLCGLNRRIDRAFPTTSIEV